ncbi:hypothetical protein EIP86_008874 [Pleurotus ostreatoroseus]|nr:hypothetical protein EIP86_008874 [Pleurotus ostreatoroseus]
MSKRKQNTGEGDGNDSDGSIVDIDFEFFDPNPEVDYLALKRLAQQLFQGDSEALQLNDLADLVLAQPEVGTTVKCDGKESDPYAFLSVLNLHVHQNRPFVKALTAYALKQSSADANFRNRLDALLGPEALQSQANHVGFVFSERLVNMPVQLMPPMYRMLAEEIQWAVEENKPFRFSQYLFLAQTYHLSAEEAAELEANAPRSAKKPKNSTAASGASGEGVFSMHPEDEYIQKPRDKESFGLDTGCRMMLVAAEDFPRLVEALAQAFPAPQ